jgi:putative two-component system response regulator
MQAIVVDDDPSSLFIVSAAIRALKGVEVTGFDDPVAALDWLDAHMPDIIFIDQSMPNLEGLAALPLMRAKPHLADVPIVMITADSSVALRVAALEKGCTDFLTKPIILPELQARAQNLLRMRQGQRALSDHAAVLSARVDAATDQLRQQARELVRRLARAAEFRDPETGAHVERMANYSRLIAERMGLDGEECRQITQAAPMHDIGKVGIPDAILLKPGRLTEPEMEVMKQHTIIGHKILEGSKHLLIKRAAEIALSHHEKFNGAGYPHGLAGEAVPLSCRIVAVADVFDALTSARPYKGPWPLDDARAYLSAQSGVSFDPACVDAFLRGWREALDIREAFRDADHSVEYA